MVGVNHLNDLVLVLLPKTLYEGGDEIHSPFNDIQYDLRVEWVKQSIETRGDLEVRKEDIFMELMTEEWVKCPNTPATPLCKE